MNDVPLLSEALTPLVRARQPRPAHLWEIHSVKKMIITDGH
jgi:hypothetical protein